MATRAPYAPLRDMVLEIAPASGGPLLRSSAAPPACAQDGPILLDLTLEALTHIRPGGVGWRIHSRTDGVPGTPLPTPPARLSLTTVSQALPRYPQELLYFLDRRRRSTWS